MGTTAEKINYAINATNDIAEGINNIGGNITQNTELADFREELDNLYSELPKTSQEGTSITLANTRRGKMVIQPKGNTIQNYYTGKNLLNTQNPLVVNEIKAINISLESGVYKISCTNVETTGNTNFLLRVIYEDDTDFYSMISLATLAGDLNLSKKSKQIVIYSQDSYSHSVGIQTTFTNLMIEKGSTKTDYEPYTGGIPSPNPDYPQEIKNVTGNNKVIIRGKNSFNWENPNIFNSYWSSITNKLVGDSLKAKSIYIECKPNSVYTVSKKSGYTFRVATTNVIPASNVEVIETVANHTSSSISINTSDNANYLWVNYFNETNGDVGNYEDMMKTIQIEEGSTATTYEPYITPIEKELNLSGDAYNYTLMKDDYITEDCVIHHKKGKVVFDGSENWELSSNIVQNKYAFYLEDTSVAFNTTNKVIVISNSFKGDTPQNIIDNGVIGICSRRGAVQGFFIRVLNDIATSLEDFKTWLSNNPVTVEYELNTETTETIPNTIPLYNQIKDLYRTIIPGGTIIIETESDEENAQLIVNASALASFENS